MRHEGHPHPIGRVEGALHLWRIRVMGTFIGDEPPGSRCQTREGRGPARGAVPRWHASRPITLLPPPKWFSCVAHSLTPAGSRRKQMGPDRSATGAEERFGMLGLTFDDV